MNLLSLIGIGFSVLVTIGNILVLCTVKFNDLKHVEASLKSLHKKVDDIDKEVGQISGRVSYIEGELKNFKGEK